MKRTMYAVLAGVALLPGTALSADVCSQGVGIPPFLSSGAKPNLMMVLDNSGSMLDSAYSKDGAFCFDDTYSSGKVYAGYFQNDTWYKWTEGYPPWQNSTSYTANSRVYMNGSVWAVDGNGGTSSASADAGTFSEDRGVTWKKVFSKPKWENGATYAVNDFVWYGPQLYKAKTAGVSKDAILTDGVDFNDATGVTWEAVDSTWLPGTSYAAKSIVSYRGVLYENTSNGTSSSSAAGLYEDTLTWKRVDEGSFAAVETQSAACTSASGTELAYYIADTLCMKIDTSKTPNRVTSFAAKGRLLNWALASKFDVEKKILTGGKHNYKDGLFVSENRGCAGSRTIKQLAVKVGDINSPPTTPPTKYLSFGVRGSRHKDAPFYEDRIDTTDDTGRLEVLAVTDSGYSMSAACQAAIAKIAKNDGDLNGTQNAIANCVESFPPSSNKISDMRPALNHSLQACWQDDPLTPEFEINKGKFNSLVDACWALYTGQGNGQLSTNGRKYAPSELRPADGGAYICYGVYDSGVTHPDRAGYMGRVWNSLGSGGTYDCQPLKPTNPKAYNCTSGNNPCYWSNNSEIAVDKTPCYKNADGYVYKCGICGGADYYDDKKSSVYGQCKTGWLPRYITVPGGDLYTADDTCGGRDGTSTGTTTGPEWEVPTWADAAGNDSDPMSGEGNGIVLAIKDYCDSLKVPEVIDPSDAAGKTSTTGGMPALLRDSELMNFLGGKDPLLTMKGFIKQADRPEGIVHNVAKDLRLGMAAFHYVGAKYECDNRPANSKLERYCPDINKDGARVMVSLENGDKVVDESDATYDSGKRRHVDNLAEAINTVRGTSWTPLAEALYTALGYYTQNDRLCLNKDGSTCLDFTIDATKDPVQYWCQDNHIILITEGESTADISKSVADLSTFPYPSTPKPFLSYEEGKDTIDQYKDKDGNALPTPKACGDDLYSSTYLSAMTWWGQNALPLYKKRYFVDPDNNQTPKQTIYTHVVATGSLISGADECSPETLMTNAAVNGGTNNYYPGENPQQLEDNLYAVLDDILSRSSAGSAASVISSSRSGSGAVYQAVFWPKHEDDAEPRKNRVSWVGDVHSLFVSADGKMYEDSDQDGRLDLTDADLSKRDQRVIFYFSELANRTRGCYVALNSDGQCPDEPPATDTTLVPKCDPAAKKCVEIQDIKYLWSANKKLAEVSDVTQDRAIYTWNDANNDGIVGAAEWFNLKELNSAKLKSLNDVVDQVNADSDPDNNRGYVEKDFLATDDWEEFFSNHKRLDNEDEATWKRRRDQDALYALVKWLQGVDTPAYDETVDDNNNGRLDKTLRQRQFKLTSGSNVVPKTWRLGDVIHSTPIVVAKPAEAYHYIYRDPTYRDFVERWASRRNMIYFGGNDGMLHAVNGGFYFENKNQFCCTNALDSDGNCQDSPKDGCATNYPGWTKPAQLGDELWAYIPYNLQPHLKCLADKHYAHKYYVDQKPRIFDAQIFKQEAACQVDTACIEGCQNDPDCLKNCKQGYSDPQCIHPGGWGTILVGAMHFGGAPVKAVELNSKADDKRLFTSAYFILDITNPDAPPTLLGEMTQQTDAGGNKYADMGYTTSSPSMVIMRDSWPNATEIGNAKTDWYLILGNGPTEMSSLDGINDSTIKGKGKVAVVPLGWLPGPVTKWEAGRAIDADTSIMARKPFRIPKVEPTSSTNEGGIFTLPGTGSSFISDIISVDYNIDLIAKDSLGARYRADAVYFGTVDGSDFDPYPPGYLPGVADQNYWKGGGRIFRLVTKMWDSLSGEERASYPREWADAWNDNLASKAYNNGPLRLLADTKMPVIGAPSIGYDGNNYWVYAGTGRFFGDQDKTDDGWCLDRTDNLCEKKSKISFFGLKEPLFDASLTSPTLIPNWKVGLPASFDYKANPLMTWGRIEWDINSNLLSGTQPNSNLNHNGIPGQRGLMQTDNIIVAQAKISKYGNDVSYLECYHCVTDIADRSRYSCTAEAEDVCYPSSVKSKLIEKIQDPAFPNDPTKKIEVPTFNKLRDYIAGTGFMTVSSKHYTTGLDGWYRDFHDARERNLGTAALLGGLLTYTTYQPFNDKCQAEGESSLYGVHFQTGTAWVQNVFGTFNKTTGAVTESSGEFVMDKLSLGRGLSTSPSMHVGTGDQAAKAFIQTSTGEIIEVTQENLPIKNPRSGRYNWTDRCSE